MFHSRGNEICAGGLHFREQLFAGLIDERDLFKVHDGVRPARAFPDSPPNRSQLVNPGTRKLAGENPVFAVVGTVIRKTKHCCAFPVREEARLQPSASALIMRNLP